MKYYRIKNWQQYQHYKDRNPPWIKLHRELLTSETWVSLDDASRVLAIASMMLAAATGNKIPSNPDYLRRVAYLHSDPNLSQLLEIDFIEFIDEKVNIASTLLADASNTHTNARPEKSRAEHKEHVSDSPTSDRFVEFWKAYPPSSRKVAKSTCGKKWVAKKLDRFADEIIADVVSKSDSKQWRDGFSPAPLTYLNQERWGDDPVKSVLDDWRESAA